MKHKIVLVGTLGEINTAVVLNHPDFPTWESFWREWLESVGGNLNYKLELVGKQELDKQLLFLEQKGYKIIYTNL